MNAAFGYRRLNQQGQALIEWALLMTLFVPLFIAMVAFSQWFVIRQRMIQVVREAAFLYSSGRMERAEVQQWMRRDFLVGSPSLKIPWVDLEVGSSGDSEQTFMQLDRVRVRFHPTSLLLRYFQNTMEESCVIKHAPKYGDPGVPFLSYGPPVHWQRT